MYDVSISARINYNSARLTTTYDEGGMVEYYDEGGMVECWRSCTMYPSQHG